MEKPHAQHVEADARFGSTDSGGEEGLSRQHQEYLLKRHGTLQLNPIPSMDDADPYNWPTWKKLVNLALVAFHAMMATFTAAAIQCAFVEIAEDLKVSVHRASYLTSLVIAVLGGAPLFWKPFAERYGRRPIFLTSLVCSLVGNIGCARSPSYATMGLCRAITGFFICPAAAIGSGVVREIFFTRDCGRYVGIWALMVTLGVPSAPFIFGFVVTRVGYRWIYWTLAMVNGIQLVLYFFLGRETLYAPSTRAGEQSAKGRRFGIRRLDQTPLRSKDFFGPLLLVRKPCVLIPAVAYSIIFLLAGILISIEIPQVFPKKFGLDAQQVGLQNLAIIIGSGLGEHLGGHLSDQWMWRREKRFGRAPALEYRLWLGYIGIGLAICGTVVFLVQTENASGQWNVTPLVGAAIAAAGNQIVTTVNITYAVQCYSKDAAGVGVFITFVRQTWGFIGPFWFPEMLDNVGFYGSCGIIVALLVCGSVIPMMVLQWQGHRWR
ncbi:major facilitator superfamily domain-containing protein [Aspergillus stella-maris]|uniref:major facilitator superfamily domain-containing protein n=1 Tax=Aspergillus stella-maris TaxID=1810926 RepID=UPI003CCCC3FF